MWPVDRGCLLLLGTWSHLWYIQRSVFAYTQICISYRTYKINYCSLLAQLSWKLKAQASYSYYLLSISPSDHLSLCKPLHFRLLLQNLWANFKQTWHKSSFGARIQVYSNKGKRFPSRGDNSNRGKYTEFFFKIFFSRTSRLNSIKLNTNYPWVKGKTKFVQIKSQVLIKGEIITKNVKMGWGHIKIFSRTTRPEKLQFSRKCFDIVRKQLYKIMVSGGWVGPQLGKLFLHVLIYETYF
jgi:hypothetical protein